MIPVILQLQKWSLCNTEITEMVCVRQNYSIITELAIYKTINSTDNKSSLRPKYDYNKKESS